MTNNPGKTNSRPRLKVGLALIAAVLALAPKASAATGYYGQRGTSRHGHSSNTDGGDVLTPKTVNVTGTTTLFGPVNVLGTANFGVRVSSIEFNVPTSTIDFTYAYVSTETYCIEYSYLKDASAGTVNGRFNGDTTAGNYNSGASCYRSASGVDGTAVTAVGFCRMTMGSGTTDASQPYSGYYCFNIEPGGGRVQAWGVIGSGMDGGNFAVGSVQGCEWTGGTPTKFKMDAGAGYFSKGWARMYRRAR